MKWTPNVWSQVKNISCDELISALEKDGWIRDVGRGAVLVYYDSTRKRRVTVHFHPGKTYRNPGLLKNILGDIGWTEDDLRRLKLIK